MTLRYLIAGLVVAVAGCGGREAERSRVVPASGPTTPAAGASDAGPPGVPKVTPRRVETH